MCCEPNVARISGASGCCCCGPGYMARRFVSSKEEAEKLKRYREQLEKEIAGIDERIDNLKKE